MKSDSQMDDSNGSDFCGDSKKKWKQSDSRTKGYNESVLLMSQKHTEQTV